MSSYQEPDWLSHPRMVPPVVPEQKPKEPKEEPEEEKESSDPFSLIQRIFILLVLLITCSIAAYCGYRIYDTLSKYCAADTEYAHLSEYYVSAIHEQSAEGEREDEVSEEPREETAEDEEASLIQVDSQGLHRQNEDYRAWFYMEDPSISYPVVQCPSDEGEPYYLYRTFEKKHNPSGSLCIAHSASSDFSDKNTIIYGHNMKNLSMFGKLKRLYGKKDTIGKTFSLNVMDVQKNYRIFAVVLTDDQSPLYRIPSDDTYETYVSDVCQAANQRDSSLKELKEHHSIVTLSTCYGSAGTKKRLLIFGVSSDQG